MTQSVFGPLEPLIGVWKGEKGLDIAPEPEGPSETEFYETITIEEVGTVCNAQSQKLAALSYHQVVTRKCDECVFHDQLGYWIWDAERSLVMQSLQVPRAVSLIAGGSFEKKGEQTVFALSAKHDDPDWGITQQPFMRDNAKTLEFHFTATVEGNSFKYKETTVLDIYGKRFDHVDSNELTKSN